MVDEAPVLPIATESGEELPDGACPECAAEGTETVFDNKAKLGTHRWNVHRVKGSHPKSKGGREKAAAKKTAGGKTTVNLNVGKRVGKGPENVQKTAQGAESFANLVAAGLVVVGQPVDAAVIAEHAPALGKAVGDLSQYQPWLTKVFAPGDAITGQGAAIAALVLVLASIAVPISVNHGWISSESATKLGVVAAAAASTAEATGTADGDDAAA